MEDVVVDVVPLSGLFFYFAAVAMAIPVPFSPATTVVMNVATTVAYGLSFSFFSAVADGAEIMAAEITAETASAK